MNMPLFHWRPFSGLAHHDSVPKTIKTIAWATGIRWVGWGFGELLIPIMLFSFSNSYAESGMLKSAWDIGYVVALPLAGVLADKMSGITLVILGLIIYPFIGVGYWAAGLTGLAVFIVATRFLNGICWALDNVGRQTYVRHHVARGKVAATFGYFDTVTNLCWIAAAIVGIFLSRWFPVHWLLLLITPASLAALVMVSRIRHARLATAEHELAASMSWHTYLEVFREFLRWDLKMHLIAVLKLFSSVADALGSFFIPILVYAGGGSPAKAVAVGVLFAVPSLLGLPIGRIAEHRKSKLVVVSLLLLAGAMACLARADHFVWQLAIALFIGFILELLNLATSGVITASVPPEHFGRVASIMSMVSDLGNLATPILLGAAIDFLGISWTFGTVASLFIALAVVFVFARKRYDGELIQSRHAPI